MKHLTLQIADVYPLADGQTVQCGPWTLTREHFESALKKVAAASRNVRITPPGYLVRSHPKAQKQADQWPARDWRFYYENLLHRLFPAPAWIYTGGHHLAVHFGPPGTGAVGTGPVSAGNEAGPLLFTLIELKAGDSFRTFQPQKNHEKKNPDPN